MMWEDHCFCGVVSEVGCELPKKKWGMKCNDKWWCKNRIYCFHDTINRGYLLFAQCISTFGDKLLFQYSWITIRIFFCKKTTIGIQFHLMSSSFITSLTLSIFFISWKILSILFISITIVIKRTDNNTHTHQQYHQQYRTIHISSYIQIISSHHPLLHKRQETREIQINFNNYQQFQQRRVSKRQMPHK